MNRKHLHGSHWTSHQPLPERHFEVIQVTRERATLRAVLTRRDVTVLIADLEDVTQWKTGWLSL